MSVRDEAITVSRWLVPVLGPVYLLLIFGGPSVLVMALLDICRGSAGRPLIWLAAPPIYAVSLAVIAGFLSRLHVHGVVKGRFPRRLDHAVYAHRRLYGLCWTAVYYFKPIYYLLLSVPVLKRMTFRLFGYRGSLDFTIYPDTWIRDLPLLDFGKGAYIANKATLGTNMALRNGTILVAPISIGENSVVGHLAELGPGVSVAGNSEVGTRSAIGIGCIIGREVIIGADVSVDHGARVRNGARIKACARVGLRRTISEAEIVEFGQVVPPRGKEDDATAMARVV